VCSEKRGSIFTFGYSSTIFATSGAIILQFLHHVAVPWRMVTPSYMTALRYSALECKAGIAASEDMMRFGRQSRYVLNGMLVVVVAQSGSKSAEVWMWKWVKGMMSYLLDWERRRCFAVEMEPLVPCG
jgi:hypothetical protein